MTSKQRHEKVANEFKKLNSTLEDIQNIYLEKISSIINKAIKKYKNTDLWQEYYQEIVDLFYAALTDTYLETSITLKNVYDNISDKIPEIEDFIYKDDKLTLPKRIKKYWDEVFKLLKQPQVDTQKIALYLLTMYNRILNNEMINVKAGVKKVKRPIIPEDGIEVVIITDGECCHNGGIYLADDGPQEPPYHVNCTCDSWHDIYYPLDKSDLEELQEIGWEDADG